MNRLASAPEESLNRGSSLVRIRNRVGSLPADGQRRAARGAGSPLGEGERVLARLGVHAELVGAAGDALTEILSAAS